MSVESTLAILNRRFPTAAVDTLAPVLEAIEDLDRLRALNLEAFFVENFETSRKRLDAS